MRKRNITWAIKFTFTNTFRLINLINFFSTNIWYNNWFTHILYFKRELIRILIAKRVKVGKDFFFCQIFTSLLKEKPPDNKFANSSFTICEKPKQSVRPRHVITVTIPILGNAENAQVYAATALAPIFTWAYNSIRSAWRSVNSVLELSAVPLFFSLFPSFRTARLLSNEGQQPSVAPGCARGIEPFAACVNASSCNLGIPLGTKLHSILSEYTTCLDSQTARFC